MFTVVEPGREIIIVKFDCFFEAKRSSMQIIYYNKYRSFTNDLLHL